MKKIIMCLLSAALIVSMTACGGAAQDSSSDAVVTESAVSESQTEQETSAASESQTEQETSTEAQSSAKSEESKSDSDDGDGIDPDFKEAMDSYEDFIADYVDFMKKYQASDGTDVGLISDYADYVSKYAEVCEDFEKWDGEDLNTAETEYYIEVQERTAKKLLEVAE